MSTGEKAAYAAAMAILLVLLGCVGGGRPREEGSSGLPAEPVTVAVISARELRSQFGHSFSENPFLSPKHLITRKSVEFIVLRLKVLGPTELELLQADAVDEAGKIRALFYPRAKFTDLAKFFSAQEQDNMTKTNKIGWYYLPAERMRVPSGSRSYLLVLVGKHPLPEKVIARVRLRVGNEEKSFEIPVNIAEVR
jgi:hypothetical protein